MSAVTRNAFKGYGYQFCVAILFSFFLEFYSNDFDELECEILKESEHNFDDIRLKSSKSEYYIQVKNCSGIDHSVILENNCVLYCGTKSQLKSECINIFVCNSIAPDDALINSSFCRIPAIEYPESKTFILYLTSDDIFEYLAKYCITTKRMDELIAFFASKLSTTALIRSCEIPKFVLYSNDLLEKTYLIRDMSKPSFTDSVSFIVAPPGFGKSHLVNELKIDEHKIYRFWISNDDNAFGERLQYINFISFLSNELFSEKRVRNEDDIIEAISKLNDWFVLDGLDHVANYAPLEFEKYKNFIEKCSSKQGLKLVVMTRPLTDSFYSKYKVVELKPWNEDECRTYCVYEGISNYSDQNRIFKITSGYPIIVHYLCDEYKRNGGVVRDLEKMNSVEDYYQNLLSLGGQFNSVIKQLSSFCALYPFVHIDDIQSLYGRVIFKSFEGIAEDYPQLIISKNGRFYFYHDSLYRFVKERCEPNIFDELYDKIADSLLNGEVRFMARAPLNYFKKGKLKRIIRKYSDFDFFISLFRNTFDIESIKAFYNKITICLSSIKDILNIYQIYSLITILLLISRNYYEDNVNLSIQIYEQLKVSNKDWKHLVFSSGYLNKNLTLIEDRKLTLLENKNIYFSRFDGDDSLEKGYEDESSFFNIADFDCCGPIGKYLEENNNYLDSYLFSEYLVSGFIHGKKECLRTVKEYLESRAWNYNLFINAFQRFKFIKLNTDSFQVSYACSLAVSRLQCLGYLPGVKNHKSIRDFLNANKTLNTFDMYKMLNGFIRYHTHFGKKLNLNEIYPYLLMMDAHKDLTVYYLPEAMAFYVRNGFFTLDECCEWIDKTYALIDDGNRGFATTFISSLGEEYVDELSKRDFFTDNHRYYVFIEDLPEEIINKLPYDVVFRRVYELFLRSSYREKEIDQEKMGNIRKSKYIKRIKAHLIKRGFVFKRIKKEKVKNAKAENPTFAQLKYGYYRSECRDDYLKY